MQAWHAPPEDIERMRTRIEAAATAPDEEAAFGVYAENLPIVHAFQAVRTQWQYAGMAGQRMGLNYHGVEAWIDRHIPRRRRRALSSYLQVMEHAVLQADHEQHEKEKE